MSEIEWAFPGPVPFSYMHVNPRELGVTSTDPYELAIQYMVHFNLWLQGIDAGKKIDVAPNAGQDTVDTSLAERNLKAQPMTEPTQEEAQEMISEGLGEKAPWEEEVKAEKKPWQKDKKPVADVKVSASIMDDF